MTFFNTNTQIAQVGLISFLDKQVEAAKVMNSSKEYRQWLILLAQNLVSLHASGSTAINIESRLRKMCSSLLGKEQHLKLKNKTSTPLPTKRRLSYGWPPNCASEVNDTSVNKKPISNNDHDLLKEILSIMASNLGLQRLYAEYKEELEFVQSSISVAPTHCSSMFTSYNAQRNQSIANNSATRANTLKENTHNMCPAQVTQQISDSLPAPSASSSSSVLSTPSLPPKPAL